jgi:hypothetical protein
MKLRKTIRLVTHHLQHTGWLMVIVFLHGLGEHPAQAQRVIRPTPEATPESVGRWMGDRGAFRLNAELITAGQVNAVKLKSGVGSTSTPRQQAMVLAAMMDFVLLRQDSQKVDINDAGPSIRGRVRDACQQVRAQYPSEAAYRAALSSVGLDPDSLRSQLEETEEANERIAQHVSRLVDPALLVQNSSNQQAIAVRLVRLGLKVRPGETTAPARLTDLIADAVMNQIEFAELVQRHSQVPGVRQDGGDLGWIPMGELDPDVTRAVQALPTGKVSAPVRTGEYWCVFLVRDRRDLDPRGSEAAFRQARETLLVKLRRRANVAILDPELRPLVPHLPEGYRLTNRQHRSAAGIP